MEWVCSWWRIQQNSARVIAREDRFVNVCKTIGVLLNANYL